MNTRKPNRLEEVYRMFPGNPVMYHPAMKLVTGSVNAGLMLSHLLYWQGKGAKGEWTYKTIEALKREIGLSRSNQDSAIQLCLQKGILEVRRKGIPATRHFRVNMPKVVAIILSLQNSGKLERPKPVLPIAGSQQTTTESTAEKYTEINTAGLNKLNQIKQRYMRDSAIK